MHKHAATVSQRQERTVEHRMLQYILKAVVYSSEASWHDHSSCARTNHHNFQLLAGKQAGP